MQTNHRTGISSPFLYSISWKHITGPAHHRSCPPLKGHALHKGVDTWWWEPSKAILESVRHKFPSWFQEVSLHIPTIKEETKAQRSGRRSCRSDFPCTSKSYSLSRGSEILFNVWQSSAYNVQRTILGTRIYGSQIKAPVFKEPPAWCCCCSIANACPTLCDHTDYSTPGFLVLHYLPEFAQTHVH